MIYVRTISLGNHNYFWVPFTNPRLRFRRKVLGKLNACQGVPLFSTATFSTFCSPCSASFPWKDQSHLMAKKSMKIDGRPTLSIPRDNIVLEGLILGGSPHIFWCGWASPANCSVVMGCKGLWYNRLAKMDEHQIKSRNISWYWYYVHLCPKTCISDDRMILADFCFELCGEAWPREPRVKRCCKCWQRCAKTWSHWRISGWWPWQVWGVPWPRATGVPPIAGWLISWMTSGVPLFPETSKQSWGARFSVAFREELWWKYGIRRRTNLRGVWIMGHMIINSMARGIRIFFLFPCNKFWWTSEVIWGDVKDLLETVDVYRSNQTTGVSQHCEAPATGNFSYFSHVFPEFSENSMCFVCVLLVAPWQEVFVHITPPRLPRVPLGEASLGPWKVISFWNDDNFNGYWWRTMMNPYTIVVTTVVTREIIKKIRTLWTICVFQTLEEFRRGKRKPRARWLGKAVPREARRYQAGQATGGWVCVYIYTHSCIYIYTHSCIYIYIYIHTYMHACLHACMHPYIRTCVRTYIHTYIHTYIDISPWKTLGFKLNVSICFNPPVEIYASIFTKLGDATSKTGIVGSRPK